MFQDASGPQLSKETAKSAMKGRKRLDEIMDHYHQVDMVDN